MELDISILQYCHLTRFDMPDAFGSLSVKCTGFRCHERTSICYDRAERSDPPGGATNEVIMGGYGLSSSWAKYSFTTNLGADAVGGVSLLFKADCGANPVCTMDVFIDNVSIVTTDP